MSFKIEFFPTKKTLIPKSEEILAQEVDFLRTREDVGFFRLPETNDEALKCINIAKRFSKKKFFIHVGIGGSALGPETIISALTTLAKQRQFVFINNIDPDDLFEQLATVDLTESLIYVVSKSGGTAETTAALSILINKLQEKGVQEESFRDYFVFATDPQKGDLRALARKWNIETFDIPSNIGGRFSVLSPVGLFPAAWADLDILKLLQGALELQGQLQEVSLFETCSFLYSAWEKGVDETVLMPYSSKLRNLSFWFTQLWAESLGKKHASNGEVVHRGLTPLSSYGATDQHSQMQLFMEGPANKVLLLIGIEEFKHDFKLANGEETASLKLLSNYTLSNLMHAELHGTLKALKEAERPHLFLSLNKLCESSLGALFLYFETLTALMGKLLEVDSFNQPGVELGKKYAYEWLRHGN